jgi:hypothetical protein
MKQDFVTFYSPGTFLSEETEKPINSWDVAKAVEMARSVEVRYSARPYGFRFLTRGREDADLDSREIARSCFYWLGGKIETAEEILIGCNSDEEVLRSNIRINGWKGIITNTNSWKFTSPLRDGDVVLASPWANEGIR